MSSKEHWENVYETKSPEQVSWTQKVPKTSLDFIQNFGLNKQAEIIDIGGGDSLLVDHLLDLGYQHITVLDISAKAIEKAKARLGDRAHLVTWIVSDVLDFIPSKQYDVWHDRAAFHFLTSPKHIAKYQGLVNRGVSGHLIIGTFSDKGPLRCSGLDIQQYNKAALNEIFEENFMLKASLTEDHFTPFDTKQHFLFCTFTNK